MLTQLERMRESDALLREIARYGRIPETGEIAMARGTGRRGGTNRPTPEEEREIWRERIVHRDYELENLVAIAVGIDTENQRSDGFHKARLSRLRHDLIQSIKSAYESQMKLRDPIAADEIERLRRVKAWRAEQASKEKDNPPRRRRKPAEATPEPIAEVVVPFPGPDMRD
jgi:hypothetical protein